MEELATVNVLMSDFERCNAYLDRLEDENAKLRELARELYDDAVPEYPSHFVKTYQSRLAELGVEVNRECTIAWLESEEA